jgi:hypothetical protein
MLFNYRYVPHTIETFQVWLDHLVKEVWCKAEREGEFSVDLLHPDFRDVVVAIAGDKSIQFKIYEPIEEIFYLFKSLPVEYRVQFGEWYDANNDIEALCANAADKIPGTYEEIELIDGELAKKLKSFCLDLWNRVLHLAPVTAEIGKIDDHYVAFVKENDEGKCPYCGLNGIKGEHHSKREAYDHFLPKGIYPFNSINFKNLAPICHECNSSYKLNLTPIRHIDPITRKDNGGRRKAFFSYATIRSNIQITMNLHRRDLNNLRPKDIALNITSTGRDEEVESWKDVFGIEERYRAACCGKNEGRAWMSRILEEYENYKLTPEAMLQAEIRAAEAKPWADANFLKKPFLVACQDAGLFRSRSAQ